MKFAKSAPAHSRNRSHKHSQLDAAKIERAQKALKAETETETIDRALTWPSQSQRRTAWFAKPVNVFSPAALRFQTSTARRATEWSQLSLTHPVELRRFERELASV